MLYTIDYKAYYLQRMTFYVQSYKKYDEIDGWRMRGKSPLSADRHSHIHRRQDVVVTYVAIGSYDCTHALE